MLGLLLKGPNYTLTADLTIILPLTILSLDSISHDYFLLSLIIIARGYSLVHAGLSLVDYILSLGVIIIDQ